MVWNKGLTKKDKKWEDVCKNISLSKKGKKLGKRVEYIKYKCKNSKCNNIMECQPSQIGHKKYCDGDCKKQHRIDINKEKQKEYIISNCRDCDVEIKTFRQNCGNLIPRKICNDCNKILRTKICKNMTIIELEKQKNDIEYKKWKIKHLRRMNKMACSSEIIKKIRLTTLKNIETRCGQIMPNYNSSAIPIIEQKAKELGIKDLQHAENGGEFTVCGYFVDGYSPRKNIVIEYYEPFHERQKERDERRKQEIINELGCEFIEIKQLENK